MILCEGIPENSPNTKFYVAKFAAPFGKGYFSVFIENNEEIGAIDYDYYSPGGIYIHYIASIETGIGYGRKMIEHLLSLPDVNTIIGEATKETETFWTHMGAIFDFELEEDDEEEVECFRENHNCKLFQLTKQQYESLYL